MSVLLLLLPLLPLSLGSSIGFQSLDQRIPNSCSTQAGSSCVFPFTYLGVTHYQCTYAASPTPWCAIATDSTGGVVTNSWGDCEVSATSSCTTEPLSVPTCTTESGPRTGQACVFPFRHLGVTYSACTSVGQSAPWCSTSTTTAGTHIEGEYGFCPSTCSSTTAATTTTTTTTTATTTTTTASPSTCTPGSTFLQDCNTCVCSSLGQAVCTTTSCTTTTTTPSPTTTTTPSSCTVSSGPATGSSCVFPFTYAGTTYTTCTQWIYGGENQGKLWCSTKVDSTGTHVNNEGNYGFCSSTCTAVSLLDILGNLVGGTRRGAGSDSVSFGSSPPRKPLPARRPF